MFLKPLATGACVALIAMAPGAAFAQAPATATDDGVVAEDVAQESAAAGAEPLITDRPDATESPDTVGRGIFQLENGYTFNSAGPVDSHSLGELLLRYGIADDVELRFGLNSYEWREVGSHRAGGLSDTELGLKWTLVHGGGVGSSRPTFAVMVSSTVPTGSSEFGTDEPQPEIRLASGWDLDERWSVAANLSWAYGHDGDVDARFHEMATSLAFGYALGDRWGAYAEYFGAYPGDGLPDENFINGGLTYLVSWDLQLDARVGYRLEGPDNDVFFGVGSALRW